MGIWDALVEQNQPRGLDDEGANRVGALGAAGMGLIAGKGAAAVPQAPPIKRMVTTFDDKGNPSHNYEGISDKAHQFLQGLMQDGAQARQSYDQAITRVSALREAIEAHPLVHTIGRIANAYAANVVAPTPAGNFARAAAQTAFGTLEHDPIELSQTEAKLASAKLATQGPILAGLDREARQQELAQYHAQREQDRARYRLERIGQDLDKLAKGQALTPEGLDAKLSVYTEFDDAQRAELKQAALLAQEGYKVEDLRQKTLKLEDYKSRQEFEKGLMQQNWALQEKTRVADRLVQGGAERDRLVATRIVALDTQRTKLADDYAQSVSAFQGVSDMLGLKGKPLPPAVIKARFDAARASGTGPVGEMDQVEYTKWNMSLNDAIGKIHAYVTGYPRLTQQAIDTSKFLSKEGQAIYHAPTPLPQGLAPAVNPEGATNARPGPATAAPAAKKYIEIRRTPSGQKLGKLPNGQIEVIP
jgi:hypothetical protein